MASSMVPNIPPKFAVIMTTAPIFIPLTSPSRHSALVRPVDTEKPQNATSNMQAAATVAG